MRHRTTGTAIVIAVLLIPVGIASATYHPTAGRWAQRDPFGYVDGLNLYEDVGTNPVAHFDPYGLQIAIKRENCSRWTFLAFLDKGIGSSGLDIGVTTDGDYCVFYARKAIPFRPGAQLDRTSEIYATMLMSERRFLFTDLTHLRLHVETRSAVVRRAASAVGKFTWPWFWQKLEGDQNTEFWQWSDNTWVLKKGKEHAGIQDVWRRGAGMDCTAAAQMIMLAAAVDVAVTPGGKVRGVPKGTVWSIGNYNTTVRSQGVRRLDNIPGDWAYIWSLPAKQTGQNIIYLGTFPSGRKLWYGHTLWPWQREVRTLTAWEKLVRDMWGGGGAKLRPFRDNPIVGLTKPVKVVRGRPADAFKY